MRAEIVRALLDSALPSLDPRRERRIDILKRLLRCTIARLTDAVEDPPRLRLLLGLVAEEGILHRDLRIRGVDGHRLAKLIARQNILANLQIGVGQIFTDRRALRRRLDRFHKIGDRRLISAHAQCVVSTRKRNISRVGDRIGRLRPNQSADGEKYGCSHISLEE